MVNKFIFGVNPVVEALLGREGRVMEVLVADGRRGEPLARIISAAAETKVPVSIVPREKLDRLAAGIRHQGVAARAREFSYSTLDVVISGRAGCGRLIVVLDQVQDPRNLGAIMRSVAFFGADGVVITERRSARVTSEAEKASAGLAGTVPIAIAGNLAAAIDRMKRDGIWVYGADAQGGKNPAGVDFRTDLAIVIGSEGSGLRRLTREKCDGLLTIAPRLPGRSLNASAACAALLYEVARQRG